MNIRNTVECRWSVSEGQLIWTVEEECGAKLHFPGHKRFAWVPVAAIAWIFDPKYRTFNSNWSRTPGVTFHKVFYILTGSWQWTHWSIFLFLLSWGGSWLLGKLFCQVERRFHSWESNRRSLPWGLGSSPSSSSSLGLSWT